MVSTHLLLHPHPLEPSYTIMPSRLPHRGLDMAHPKGSEQLFCPFCMAGSFYFVVLRSHVTWLGRSSLPKKATCHITLLPSPGSVSPWHLSQMEFISFFFFFQFAYLDIICLLAGISAPRGQGSVLAILSPQPGLVTTTWLVPSKRQMIEWMCQLELWRN